MNRITAITIAFMLMLLASGCAQFQNRIVVSADCQKVYHLSEYMKVGISSQVSTADATVVANAVCRQKP